MYICVIVLWIANCLVSFMPDKSASAIIAVYENSTLITSSEVGR